MGAGDGFGVEPDVRFGCFVEGEVFVLCVAGAKPYTEAVNHAAFYLGCLLFPRLTRPFLLLLIEAKALQFFL